MREQFCCGQPQVGSELISLLERQRGGEQCVLGRGEALPCLLNAPTAVPIQPAVLLREDDQLLVVRGSIIERSP